MKDQTGNVPHIDCLQSAFPLKIRLLLISASAIANDDITLQLGISQQSLIFSSRAYALVYRCSRLRRSHAWVFSCSNFAKKNKRLLAVYSPHDGTFVHYFLLNIPSLTKNTSDQKRPPPPPHLYHVLKWIRILSPIPSLHTTQRGLCRGQSSSLTSYPIILFHASSSFDLCFKIRGARLRVKDKITEDN